MAPSRRDFLTSSSLGILATALEANAQTPAGQFQTLPPGAPPAFGTAPPVGPQVSSATFAAAEKLVQVEMTPADRAQAAENWRMQMAPLLERRTGPRKAELEPTLSPASQWNPSLNGLVKLPQGGNSFTRTADPGVDLPANDDDIAFAPVHQLSRWIESRKLTSTRLTEIYLTRLQRFSPKLRCVITLTSEHALAQAKQVDAEIAADKYRGPLHGIPWGAKDLLAVKGYPTTWGAGGFEHQTIDEDATVVQRLDEAGAILVAKFTLGALAMGDKWFGGRTRNPWNTKQGSSGSSAGPASAVAAGCVPFAIGSETLGSISSPSTRCGDTGLRPTFGLVPRTGAMALSWTMDKLGPIARSAEDCALVIQAIHGPDGKDTAAWPATFEWNPTFDWKNLRIGYLKSAFDPPEPLKLPEPQPNETAEEKTHREERIARMKVSRARSDYDRKYDLAALDKLRSMGVNLIPVELPKLPYDSMTPLLTAEAAAAFDDLTMSGRDSLLTEQSEYDWPNGFRVARFYPAVEYIQANRARTLAIQQVSALFEQVDIVVTPTNGEQLVVTNLTGHPALIVPNGLRGADAPPPPKIDDGEDDNIGGPGTPVSLTFLAGHYQDATLAAFGAAYQQATNFHKQHPNLG